MYSYNDNENENCNKAFDLISESCHAMQGVKAVTSKDVTDALWTIMTHYEKWTNSFPSWQLWRIWSRETWKLIFWYKIPTFKATIAVMDYLTVFMENGSGNSSIVVHRPDI